MCISFFPFPLSTPFGLETDSRVRTCTAKLAISIARKLGFVSLSLALPFPIPSRLLKPAVFPLLLLADPSIFLPSFPSPLSPLLPPTSQPHSSLIFIVPEDIVEVRPRLVLTFTAALMALQTGGH